MKLEDVKKYKVAYTHGGKFHSDDVFGGAFLKIINPNIEIRRVMEVDDRMDGIVFDIGKGEFDHHQSDNECRINGVPYAAFGKLWRAFAPSMYGEYVYKSIDEKFIEHLDLSDNTGIEDTLATAIDAFNPKSANASGDKEFNMAVDFAKIVLEGLINKAIMYEKDYNIVKDIYKSSKDKNIIILDKHYHFHDYLPKTDALFVIFPNKRGGYSAEAVTKSSRTVESKIPFPKSWLSNLPKGINFCHNSGFMIVGDTIDDVINACKLVISGDNNDR